MYVCVVCVHVILIYLPSCELQPENERYKCIQGQATTKVSKCVCVCVGSVSKCVCVSTFETQN